MTPEQLQEFNDMKQRLARIERAEGVSFLESLARRLSQSFLPIDAKLSDLSDVEDTDDATDGQVLKKTATTWQPGTDNTA